MKAGAASKCDTFLATNTVSTRGLRTGSACEHAAVAENFGINNHMTIGRRRSLRAAFCFALCATAGAVAADRLGFVQGAQAQSKEEEDKKKD